MAKSCYRGVGLKEGRRIIMKRGGGRFCVLNGPKHVTSNGSVLM